MIERRERPAAFQSSSTPNHPLDPTTRDLIRLLYQKGQMVETLDSSLAQTANYPALHELLQRMRNEDTRSIQELETLLRRRLRPCSPDAVAEPW